MSMCWKNGILFLAQAIYLLFSVTLYLFKDNSVSNKMGLGHRFFLEVQREMHETKYISHISLLPRLIIRGVCLKSPILHHVIGLNNGIITKFVCTIIHFC
jgi:hypothetical protein